MWRQRKFIAITLIVFASTPVFANDKVHSDVSWGKAGASFEDYRADSQECARLGANSDMTDTEAAKTIIRGIDRQDTDLLEGINSRTVREYIFTAQRSRFK